MASRSLGPNNGIASEFEVLDEDVEEYTAEPDLSSTINGKHKRTQSSTIEQPHGQRSIKRAKRHTFEPAVAPDVLSLNEPDLRALDYTPTATFETPSPDDWLSEAYGNRVFQTGTRWPDFPPADFPSAHVEPWNGEGFSFEGQGYIPAINN